MIRATTPTFIAKIKGVDLTLADAVYITIRQFGREITLTGGNIVVTSSVVSGEMVTEIQFHLSQESSLGLSEGDATIQCNWIYTYNEETLRGATKVSAFPIDKQTLERTMP